MSSVDVYRNLTRRCWSVRQGGRLVAHRDAVTLMDVRFHVSEAGRQRVIRLGQRSVMAHATGTICEARLWPSAVRIRFCPYSGPAFVDEEGAPVATAHLVHFSADGAAWGILS